MTAYQRFSEIKKIFKYDTDSALARDIGLLPQNITDMKRRGGESMSKKVMMAISNKWPEINPSWLMGKDVDMFTTGPSDSAEPAIDGTIDSRYIKHLEEEIIQLRKRNQEQWELIQKLVK